VPPLHESIVDVLQVASKQTSKQASKYARMPRTRRLGDIRCCVFACSLSLSLSLFLSYSFIFRISSTVISCTFSLGLSTILLSVLPPCRLIDDPENQDDARSLRHRDRDPVDCQLGLQGPSSRCTARLNRPDICTFLHLSHHSLSVFLFRMMRPARQIAGRLPVPPSIPGGGVKRSRENIALQSAAGISRARPPSSPFSRLLRLFATAEGANACPTRRVRQMFSIRPSYVVP
jgi:hypothetical protein